MLAHAIAGELDVPFFKVSAPALVGSASGDSERSIRALFAEVMDECKGSTRGCMMFIDEIDVITPKRETAQREMERRIVAQLLSCLDELTVANTGGKPVLVLGATNRPDSIDPALRRAGRFDREISIPIPNLKQRQNILTKICQPLRLGEEITFDVLATKTPGYVGADLKALVNEASLLAVCRAAKDIISGGKKGKSPQEPSPLDTMAVDTAVAGSAADDMQNAQATASVDAPADAANAEGAAHTQMTTTSQETIAQSPRALPTCLENTPETPGQTLSERSQASSDLRLHDKPFTAQQMSKLCVLLADFEGALLRVQPSAKREGFATVPEVTWNDVGALSGPRRELEDAAVLPLQHPELCRKVGIPRPPGVLLYGPPGCGKTLLAKAVANSSNANFISIKGPELLNKFVGESERAVRMVFHRARTSSPCIIFFDELDALCPKRENDSGSRGSQRLVNQLLTEMDGFDNNPDKQVFVIAATNRPDIIDPAMLRPANLNL